MKYILETGAGVGSPRFTCEFNQPTDEAAVRYVERLIADLGPCKWVWHLNVWAAYEKKERLIATVRAKIVADTTRSWEHVE